MTGAAAAGRPFRTTARPPNRPNDSRADLRYGVAMPVSVIGSRRLLVVLAATLGIAVASPLGALAQGAPSASAGLRAAATTPFTLDLSTDGDFVAQANFVQCVGASMQIMLNMIRAEDDRTKATQAELQVLARSLSGHRPDGRERQGASIRGWTAGLNQLGAGPYRTTGAKEMQSILRIAAEAMRETNRPVGLLVWRGRHAWVMAGFTATSDPRYTDDFEVTRVIIIDPLYPYGSKTWGPSPEPRESLTVDELGRQFVPRGQRGSTPGGGSTSSGTSGWSQGLSGKYVVALPYTVVDLSRSVRSPH